MLRYLTIPVTPFAQNCSLLWCDDTMDAAVVDPGCEVDRLPGQRTPGWTGRRDYHKSA